MKEFRVHWVQCPTAYNTSRVFFVEAATANDADAIARNYIERKYGIEWFQVKSISETKPIPEGKVIEYGQSNTKV